MLIKKRAYLPYAAILDRIIVEALAVKDLQEVADRTFFVNIERKDFVSYSKFLETDGCSDEIHRYKFLKTNSLEGAIEFIDMFLKYFYIRMNKLFKTHKIKGQINIMINGVSITLTGELLFSQIVKQAKLKKLPCDKRNIKNGLPFEFIIN